MTKVSPDNEISEKRIFDNFAPSCISVVRPFKKYHKIYLGGKEVKKVEI